MKSTDKLKTILHIRPNAVFVMRDDVIEWLDSTQKEPTEKEIETGWIAYQESQIAENKAKETAKAALLSKLGITAEEAVLLLS